MRDCLPASHLRELSESALADYDRRIAVIPPALCAPFNIEAMRLQDELVRIYKSVVFCVREEPNLEEVASWWGTMIEMCDSFAGRLSNLKEVHPLCGADYFYDNILDLRNKCQRLREMHL